MKKKILITLGVLVGLAIVGVGVAFYLYRGPVLTNPRNYATVGDIPTPWGYERVASAKGDFTEYLRSLPLMERGSQLKLYTGGNARLQSRAYAVVDLPLLSNAEQCADVCMRLRAEFLFGNGQRGAIWFQDVNGVNMRYSGSASRKEFERYLRNVYANASTFSMKREMPRRKLLDMQPGDVFVYDAGDRTHHKYLKVPSGHAVMVVDVAVDKNGKKAFLLAEGNTPARDIHVMPNWLNPFASPWHYVDDDDESLFFCGTYYRGDELYGWD